MAVGKPDPRDTTGIIDPFMRKHGLNQSSLARRLGVSQPAVARWRAGHLRQVPLLPRALRDLGRELDHERMMEQFHRMAAYDLYCPTHGVVYEWADSATQPLLLDGESQMVTRHRTPQCDSMAIRRIEQDGTRHVIVSLP